MTTYLVPVLIDPTGVGADVSDAIQGWIDGTTVTGGFPNPTDGASSGSRNTIKLQPGANYRCNKGLNFTQFSNIDLDWNGGGFVADIDNPFGIRTTSIDFSTSTFLCAQHGLDGTKPIKVGSGVVTTLGIVNHGSYWPLKLDNGRYQLALIQGGAPITVTTQTGKKPDDKIDFTNAPVTNTVNGVNNPSNLRPWLFSDDFAGQHNFARAQVTIEACVNFRTMTSSGRGTIQGSQVSLIDGHSGDYDARYEGQAAVLVLGGTNIETAFYDAIETRGDGLQCVKSSNFGQRTNGLWAHDWTCKAPGRHGWSVGNGGAQNVTIEDWRVDGAPRHTWDLEDDTANGSGIIDTVTIRRGWARGGLNTDPNNLNRWGALGGNSVNEGNIVIGGLPGHPEDGNVAVGYIHGFGIDWHVLNATARRGPLAINYNVGGGSVVLHTTVGQLVATYTAGSVLNTSSFSDTDVMRYQSVAASTLPTPCRIDAVNETVHTVTLSHPATATGTVTAVFGNQWGGAAPFGAFMPVQWDGVQGIGNVVVLQPGIGDVAFYCQRCSGVDVHDNIVFGGGELINANPVTSPTKNITGTAPFTFAASGTISASPLDAMNGSAPFVFAASGVLAHVRNISGTAPFAFAASGTFDATVPSTDELFGVADLEFAAVGTLTLHHQAIEGVGSVVERGPGFGKGRFGRGFFGGLPG